jgi:hypothetical protein
MSEIAEFVDAEPLFETHTHQLGFDGHRWDEKSFEDFIAYGTADLEVAGATFTSGDAARTFSVWPYARTTGYGQAADLGARALFGRPFSAGTADELTRALRAFCRGRTSAEIHADLYARANIRWSINDMFWAPPGRTDAFSGAGYLPFVRFAPRFEERGHTLVGASRDSVRAFEAGANVSIHSLAELDRALDDYAARLIAGGRVAAFKVAVAYGRDLSFAPVDASTAAPLFQGVLRGGPVDARPLSDYLFHRLLARARQFARPVQIHTGYLAGTWGDLRNGDPRPLVPVFRQYRDVRFDLFHAAWPWTSFLGAVGKAFPNVWLDLCWAWAMNPVQTERTLDEWLSAVPCNKILGFGADTQSPVSEIGYALQARRGIARVLERKIERGEFDAESARFVARRLLSENALDLFGAGS